MDFAYAYAGITKSEKHDDGTITVYGKATDDSLDVDKQICDDAWLQKAMPEWFVAGGNIREQHSSIAAGVATDYEAKADGHYITALIVDPVSVKKVETGVLKGFSIGIRNPRVIRDDKAAGGRIVDGMIIEISVVDRPANSNAKMTIAKSLDGDLVAVDQVLEETHTPTPADVAKNIAPIVKDVVVSEEVTPAVEEVVAETVAEEIVEAPVEEVALEEVPAEPVVEEAEKSVEAEIVKGDIDLYNAAILALAELIKSETDEIVVEGESETKDIKCLLKAMKHLQKWHKIEAEKGELAPLPSDNMEEELEVMPEEMLELSASIDPTQVENILTKAVAAATESVTAELDLLKSALVAEKEKATKLEADLEVAKSAVVSGGPKRAAIALKADSSILLVEASKYLAKADETSDKFLAEGYREIAADLQKQAKKGTN